MVPGGGGRGRGRGVEMESFGVVPLSTGAVAKIVVNALGFIFQLLDCRLYG